MESKEVELHFQRPPFQLLPIPPDPGAPSQPPLVLRSLPDLVSFNAIKNAHHIFCLQSSRSQSTAEKFQFTPITYQQLGYAVGSCCEWLLQKIPSAHPAVLTDDFSVRKAPPVALFLESDVGLFIYMIALLTLNIPCVLLSIRLNSTAVVKLLEETGAWSVIVSSRTVGRIEDALLKANEAGHARSVIYTAAPFNEFLGASFDLNASQHFAHCQQCIREDDQNVIILHSSGTTGLPKAIPLAHRYLLGYAACHLFPPTEDESKRGINLSTLPLFHGFGVLAPSLALSVGKTVCFPPSATICNGALVLRMMEDQKMSSLMTVPTILEEIVQGSAAKKLGSLDFVVVGGGPIKDAVAEALRANDVNLLNHFGATELGALAPIFRPGRSYDWRYLRLRTDLGLQLKRTEPSAVANSGHKLVGRPFGSKTDFELQDSVEINPLNPEVEVKLTGRNDDLLVLATGEKVSPHSMELILERDPRVKRAVVFGTGQFEVGVLVDPISPVINSDEFIESFWPVILDANKKVDQHACITTKAAILLKPPGKSIPLSDKGSLQRKEVYSAFESEINSVYDRLEEGVHGTSAVAINPENPRKGLREIVQISLMPNIKPNTWNDDDDFVQLGMDSLQATRLRRTLEQSLRKSIFKDQYYGGLPLDFVYAHSSIQKLIEALHSSTGIRSSPVAKSWLMCDLSRKFAFFDENGPSMTGVNTILLTGTTGNLGSHLLQIVSEQRRVPSVVCLVRAKPDTSPGSLRKLAVSAQQEALDARGIVLSEDAWSKVKILAWQPGKDLLGLEEEDYHHLTQTTTHIFHGAWPMDFQMGLSSFELQIKALQDLINLARFAHRFRPSLKPRIILASSIAVVGKYAVDRSAMVTVPEIPLNDSTRAPLMMGYAEAKWVCEQMMESAYNVLQCEVQPMIVRIGQLTGSQISGYWSLKEHIPALVKSSMAIRHMPDLHGTLSWLPVNQAARTVADLLLRCEPRDLVFHLENPVRQPWPEMCTFIEHSLGLTPGSRLPFSEWLNELWRLDESPSNLLQFLKNEFLYMSGGNLVLDTRECQKLSPTLRSIGAIGPKDIDLYVAFWRQSGFLTTS